MANNVTCNVCGGSDFHKEEGFYYCNECQTQTQDIREQVFEQLEETLNVTRLSTKVIKDKAAIENANKAKLTSWETLNYILAGLVKEFMALGASSEFKDITYRIWQLYLTKLEVISTNPSRNSKMNVLYRRRDAEIIYSRKSRQKRKRSTSAASTGPTSDTDSKSLSRELSRRKRLLVQAEYDQAAVTQSSTDVSVLNPTLSSLSSDEETSSVEGEITYSEVARKELLKQMSRKHLEKHIKDVNNELKCHKHNKNLVSDAYRLGPYVVTRNKLYSIMYIGLLLSREKFQLSDLIRFCREGHLSYMDYKDFFPDILEKNIDQSVFSSGQKGLFSYNFVRKSALSVYKVLSLKPCNFRPNLVELCKRYCTELNLPDEIYRIAGNLIEETKPQLNITESSSSIPNYEGRTMAFIIYVLKVLFSLDDVTEFQFTKFAQLINENQQNCKHSSEEKAFVWSDWFSHIEYRKIVLKNTHFPTKFLLSPESITGSNIFADFIYQRKAMREYNDNQALAMKVMHKVLTDLDILQDSPVQSIEMKHSLTPFRSYIQALQNSNVRIDGLELNKEALEDFSKCSVNFLIHPHSYLRSIKSEECEIVDSNAHQRHKYVKMTHTVNYCRRDPKIVQDYWEEIFKKQKYEELSFHTLVNKMVKKQMHKVLPKRKGRKKRDTSVLREGSKKGGVSSTALEQRQKKGKTRKADTSSTGQRSEEKATKKGKLNTSSFKERTIYELDQYTSFSEEESEKPSTNRQKLNILSKKAADKKRDLDISSSEGKSKEATPFFKEGINNRQGQSTSTFEGEFEKWAFKKGMNVSRDQEISSSEYESEKVLGKKRNQKTCSSEKGLKMGAERSRELDTSFSEPELKKRVRNKGEFNASSSESNLKNGMGKKREVNISSSEQEPKKGVRKNVELSTSSCTEDHEMIKGLDISSAKRKHKKELNISSSESRHSNGLNNPRELNTSLVVENGLRKRKELNTFSSGKKHELKKDLDKRQNVNSSSSSEMEHFHISSSEEEFVAVTKKGKQRTSSSEQKHEKDKNIKHEPTVKFAPNQRVLKLKTVAVRDSKGRFCKMDSPDKKPDDTITKKRPRNKWFVSSWTENPMLKTHVYNNSLLNLIRIEEESKEKQEKKRLRVNEEYKVHYVPRHEYWINVKDVSSMSEEKWRQFEATLPKNFQWLLEECARVIEQSTKDLFIEFVNVELYINYVHLNKLPVLFKRYDNYKDIFKLIAKSEKNW